jgi:probable rRNA maturation factor
MPTRKTRGKTTRRPGKGRARIAIQFAPAVRGVPSAARLRAWARAAMRPRDLRASEIVLRVVGAAEGRRLNRAFRGRDYPTNVLTFAYARAPLRGDIVLCGPVIAREARARRKTPDAHYAHLVVHGVLHLRGLDHVGARDAARMESAERRILGRLGYGDPYVVDSAGAR